MECQDTTVGLHLLFSHQSNRYADNSTRSKLYNR